MGNSSVESACQKRRTFIKAAGAAASAAALGALAPALAEANDEALSVEQVEWDEECELAVVGAGLAGMCTAVAAVADCGATKVIVFEKGEAPGGCSPFSDCRFTYTDAEHRDEFVRYLINLEQGKSTVPQDVYEAWADGCTQAIDWIRSLGALDEAIADEPPGEASPTQAWCYPEWPEIEGADAIGNFRVVNVEGTDSPSSIYTFMQAYADGTDAIDVRNATPVTALVQDPATRRVLGVVAEAEGRSVYVRATKGVVMCCGGFENDTDMVQNYLGLRGVKSIGATLNAGDGIRMCARCGADLWHMRSTSSLAQCLVNADGIHFTVAAKNGIKVGSSGRRFIVDSSNSSVSAADPVFPYLGRRVETVLSNRHGHINYGGDFICPVYPPSWEIVDAEGYSAEGFITKGSFGALDYEGDPVENGDAVMGDTLTELAEKVGFPEDELERTVEEWNTMCDAGVDYAFHRDPATMKKLETPPFYAVKLGVSLLNTMGGPKRSAKAEVLDVDGEPIPGLYEAGELGSVTGTIYQGGCNISESGVFGRIAAHSAFGLE